MRTIDPHSLRPLVALVLASALVSACGSTVPVSSRITTTSGDVAGLGGGGTAPGPTPGTSSGPAAFAGSSTRLPGAAPGATPGTTTTSAAGSAAAGTRGSVVGGPAAYNAVPVTGPGWDAMNVYVGVTTQTDVEKAGNAAGINTFDFGDQKAIMEAMIDEINETGGIFGRKLVAIAYDVKTGGDAATQNAEACALWTQDHRVTSVSLNPTLNTPQMWQCLHKANTPIITGGSDPYTVRDMAPYQPELSLVALPSLDRLLKPWISSLESSGYFGKWDVNTGASGTAPVKIALMYEDTPFFQHAWADVKKELERRGYVVQDVLTYTAGTANNLSNYALKMRADGVTHLFMDFLASALYPTQAESQGFRARFAVSSFNALQPFMAGLAPAAQLHGLTGVGWVPTLDVAQAQDPGITPGQSRCLNVMRKRGVDVSKRNYKSVAYFACDKIFLRRDVALRGGGLDALSFEKGLRLVAPTFPWAGQFPGSPTATDNTLISEVRPLRYDVGCACITYFGPRIKL